MAVASSRRLALPNQAFVTLARGPSQTHNGSIFTAQLCYPVRDVKTARLAIAAMRQEGCCSSADHNMTAYRVGGTLVAPSQKKKSKIDKEYDDDGEAHGGQRLLGCLTKKDACNVAVIVSRVYGGVNIGKRRFELIVETAAMLLDAVGHVPGRGIEHGWGEGQVLGGEDVVGSSAAAGSSSSSSSAPAARPASSSSGKKRKRDVVADAADAEEQRRALREAAALAAERRFATMSAVDVD